MYCITNGAMIKSQSSARRGIVAATMAVAFYGAAPGALEAQDSNSQNQSAPAPQTTNIVSTPQNQRFNWHVQNTDIVQADPGFSSKYSGPASLSSGGETRETVSLDLFLGLRLWTGAEFHVDGLVWQGFGLSKTEGIEAFPNGEAYRLGTKVPNIALARAFIRQTFNLGGESESIPDDQLTLAGKQDISRITITLGELSTIDVFDNNTYAHDPRTQFMNWALVGNEAWDYPADSIGYTSGITIELNQPKWALRYGFFQVPRVSNGMAIDGRYFVAWGMVTELERRWAIKNHPGVIRLLTYLNEAHMGSYEDALSASGLDITQSRADRVKYGFCLNWEQEIITNIGLFSRVGWSDGHTEAWMYSDVDQSASAGTSIKGGFWHRPNDTVGLAGVINGISREHKEFLEAGGVGILAGDGALNYGLERTMETYYDCAILENLHASLDYQLVINPAFNKDRGPVSIFGARLHWEY
jgi:high affinity Mn2+ porin